MDGKNFGGRDITVCFSREVRFAYLEAVRSFVFLLRWQMSTVFSAYNDQTKPSTGGTSRSASPARCAAHPRRPGSRAHGASDTAYPVCNALLPIVPSLNLLPVLCNLERRVAIAS